MRRPLPTAPRTDTPLRTGGEGKYTLQHHNNGPHPKGKQAYCTCGAREGYTFDPAMGIYVHPDCWLPSKAYYLAAIEAGIITHKEK